MNNSIAMAITIMMIFFTNASEASESPAEKYNICLTGLAVSPAKSDGSKWDGWGKISSEQKIALNGLLQFLKTPQAFVADVLVDVFANPLLKNLQRPDLHGEAKLDGDVRLIASPQSPLTGTIVRWDCEGVQWKNVVLHNDTRIRVTIQDKDVRKSEFVGTVNLNFKHLKNAYDAAEVVFVNTSNQDAHILAVGIEVTKVPANTPAPPPPTASADKLQCPVAPVAPVDVQEAGTKDSK